MDGINWVKIPTRAKLKFHPAPGFVCGELGNCLGGPIDGKFYYTSSLDDQLAWKPDESLTDEGENAKYFDPDNTGRRWVTKVEYEINVKSGKWKEWKGE